MNPKLEQLERYLADVGPVAVAVSGGVDSMTLAVVAHRVNPATQQFHAVSAAVPTEATLRVKHYAAEESWNLHLVNAGETSDPRYVENPANRCYFCKTNLYDTLAGGTDLPLVSGTNLDDLGDYRPGLIAADEHEVLHPYVETGISKSDLRGIARDLGLHDLKDLPAAPCLSSRVTTGIPIDPGILPLINDAENVVRQILGEIEAIRCRILPDGIAIELNTGARGALTEREESAIHTEVLGVFAGRYETLSIRPYERGSAFLINTLEVD